MVMILANPWASRCLERIEVSKELPLPPGGEIDDERTILKLALQSEAHTMIIATHEFVLTDPLPLNKPDGCSVFRYCRVHRQWPAHVQRARELWWVSIM